MTMRRIAGELGCDPMALYRHFPDRTALLDAVAELALRDAAAPDAAAPGGPDLDAGAAWDERLRGELTAVRGAALRHPGIAAHIASRPPLGEAFLGGLASALGEAGLAPGEGVRAAQALVAYLSSAIAMAVRAGAPDERWEQVKAAVGRLPGAPPGEALPVVGSDEQFDYGLGLLLSGIRAQAAAPRGESR